MAHYSLPRSMIENTVIQTLMDHRSIRRFTDQTPSEEIVDTIIRAGQQAPFATQCYSLLLSRRRDRNPWRAPLLFTVCVDSHKFELIMAERQWRMVMNDLGFLLLAVQDASFMSQNMVVAGRSLGLGSCFLGGTYYRADRIAEEYELPLRVLPIVQLAMGYPADSPPTRPRYPRDYTVFEDRYPVLQKNLIHRAMDAMDRGYLDQEYYKNANTKIPLTTGRPETYTLENYSWTEHISRNLGQWQQDPSEVIEQLRKRGFDILPKKSADRSS